MAINQNTLAAQFLQETTDPTVTTSQDSNSVVTFDGIDPTTIVIDRMEGASTTVPITVFQPFTQQDIITNQVVTETRGLWSNGTASLDTFYTGSLLNDIQKSYYFEIYSVTESCDIVPEFFIAYGNRNGYGQPNAEGQEDDTPTKAIYSQYRQLLLNPNVFTFSFKSGSTTVDSDSIYVINVNTKLMGDKLDPGNFELALAKLTGDSYSPNEYTASGDISVDMTSDKIVTLIDDSLDSNDITPGLTTSLKVFNIVSGSIENGVYSGDTESYGLFYADYGILVLNANKVNAELAFNVTTASNVDGNNILKLFTSISGAALPTDVREDIYPFYARRVEIKTNSYYYVRLRNYQFNYSTNPSYYNATDGTIKNLDFKYNPVAYITTIGLYNRNYELLAVAKFSKPLKKTFFDEYLITIKVEY